MNQQPNERHLAALSERTEYVIADTSKVNANAMICILPSEWQARGDGNATATYTLDADLMMYGPSYPTTDDKWHIKQLKTKQGYVRVAALPGKLDYRPKGHPITEITLEDDVKTFGVMVASDGIWHQVNGQAWFPTGARYRLEHRLNSAKDKAERLQAYIDGSMEALALARLATASVARSVTGEGLDKKEQFSQDLRTQDAHLVDMLAAWQYVGDGVKTEADTFRVMPLLKGYAEISEFSY